MLHKARELTTVLCSALINMGLENSVQLWALQLWKYPGKVDILQGTAMNDKVSEQLSLSSKVEELALSWLEERWWKGMQLAFFGMEVSTDIDVAHQWAGWTDDLLCNGGQLSWIAGEQQLVRLWIL